MGRAASTLLAVAALALTAACGELARAETPASTVGFPRTAAYFLEHEELPDAATLAAYDLVVIDSEWSHRLPASYFAELRDRNPDVTLLAYVNVVDHPRELGSQEDWADRYALWGFENGTTSRFPQEWFARTAGGTRVSEWPQTTMTNLTDAAPEVDGETFGEHAVDWMVETVWAAGVWDGLFLDVWTDRIYTPTIRDWDIDGDGTDESYDDIFGPESPWERGIDQAERQLRERLPDAVLVANGDRTLRGDQLDGRVWEHFSDPLEDRDDYDLRTYADLNADGAHREPGTTITIDRRPAEGRLTDEDLQRARYFLTATLLQDGYWAPTGLTYGELPRYDEMDGAGLGAGYLGLPIVDGPSWSEIAEPYSDGLGAVEPQVYRRDFEQGVVLHNAGDVERTVDLGEQLRRLDGTQDPTVNDGQTVREVTVPARDGLVLLRR